MIDNEIVNILKEQEAKQTKYKMLNRLIQSTEGSNKMAEEIVEIDNPCYHCYAGARDMCVSTSCKYAIYPWSGDLFDNYKVKVEKKEACKC